MSDQDLTPEPAPKFDFDAYPPDTCFYDRRTKKGDPPVRASEKKPKPERAPRPERRKRIDPTTFDRSYSRDEMEFMNAMQQFKVSSGKHFPSYGEVLKVAAKLGYRKEVYDDEVFATEEVSV